MPPLQGSTETSGNGKEWEGPEAAALRVAMAAATTSSTVTDADGRQNTSSPSTSKASTNIGNGARFFPNKGQKHPYEIHHRRPCSVGGRRQLGPRRAERADYSAAMAISNSLPRVERKADAGAEKATHSERGASVVAKDKTVALLLWVEREHGGRFIPAKLRDHAGGSELLDLRRKWRTRSGPAEGAHVQQGPSARHLFTGVQGPNGGA